MFLLYEHFTCIIIEPESMNGRHYRPPRVGQRFMLMACLYIKKTYTTVNDKELVIIDVSILA